MECYTISADCSEESDSNVSKHVCYCYYDLYKIDVANSWKNLGWNNQFQADLEICGRIARQEKVPIIKYMRHVKTRLTIKIFLNVLSSQN